MTQGQWSLLVKTVNNNDHSKEIGSAIEAKVTFSQDSSYNIEMGNDNRKYRDWHMRDDSLFMQLNTAHYRFGRKGNKFISTNINEDETMIVTLTKDGSSQKKDH